MGEQVPAGAPLLAFEQMAVAGGAARVRDSGERTAQAAADLVAVLEEASAAAAGVQAGAAGGLLTGPALAECAVLLARRAADHVADTERMAEGMTGGAALLVEADEEVAHRVNDAAS